MVGGNKPSYTLGILDFFYRQCEQAMQLGTKIIIQPPVNAIVIAGVGGSALVGDMLSCYLQHTIPFFINQTYHLPGWVNKNTVVVVASYSGNTDETIAMYRQARKKNAKILVITSGGDLKEMAFRDQVPLIEVPRGMNQRDAMGFLALPILNVLQNSRLIPATKDMLTMIRTLRQDHKEKAREIAKKLPGTIPLLYSSQPMYCVAKAWKILLNETAKMHAFWNTMPEMNHHEINSFAAAKHPYFCLFITDANDSPEIQKRMEATRVLLSEKNIHTLELRLTGENRLARIFSAFLLGEYVAYYLAIETGIDPEETSMVKALRAKLD
ncbi:bifunctional phosphoglucose/phosphomannose isomerase [Candidatus Woesearchaeota archaeon]|nr:bifunctional phosphoglucose/phosphomannose isomerase [Candidatus Woesearchaeota archaeon]